MKFLVLGCNGMAGHLVSIYLKEQGHNVIGFAREKSKYVNTMVGDASDFEEVKKAVFSANYDSVVNCIGILNQFAEDHKETAVLLNSYLPHYLAKVTENTDTQIIHISTDCVFSGKKGNYVESDFRDGESFYDRSKALGEIDNGKDVTLRQSIVGPDIKESGIGLLNWFMKQSGEINGYTKAMWTGQTTLQLAKTIEKAAEKRINGIYNMVPDCSISKYELLKLFNHYLRDDQIKINPVDGVNADKSLKRIRYDFDYIIPNYETMVSELAEWMKAHKDLYPYYDI